MISRCPLPSLAANNEAAHDGEEGQGALHHRDEPRIPKEGRAKHFGEGQGGGAATAVHRLRQRIQSEQDPVSLEQKKERKKVLRIFLCKEFGVNMLEVYRAAVKENGVTDPCLKLQAGSR